MNGALSQTTADVTASELTGTLVRWVRLQSFARWALALAALNVAWLGLRYALDFPQWCDEAFLSWSFLTRDAAGMLHPLEYGQVAPLGYMWLVLAVTRIAGVSEYALRLVPFAAGLASVALFWRLTRRTLGRHSGLLSFAVFCASYFVVRYGAEAKPYGTDLLVAIVLLSAGASVLDRPRCARRWAMLTALSVASVWLSFPAVFMVGGVGLAVLFATARSRDSRALAALLTFTTLAACSFVAAYLLYARDQARSSAWLFEMPMWTSGFPPLAAPWRLPLWILDIHAGEMLAYPIGGKHGASLIPLLLTICGSIALWRRKPEIVVLLLGPLVLTFAAACLRLYPYGSSIRTSLYMAPAFCLLEGAGIAAVIRRFVSRHRIRTAMGLAVVACIAIVAAGIARDCIQPYKSVADLENRRVLQDLAARTGPQDEWVCFNAVGDVPHAPNILAWGGSGARFRYYVARLAPRPAQWGLAEISPQKSGRVFVLVYRDNKVRFREGLLTAWLVQTSTRWGTPLLQRHDLGGAESIDVYEFAATSG